MTREGALAACFARDFGNLLSAWPRSRQNVCLFRCLCKPVIECITGAPHGAYRILFAGGVEQLAQAPDMHIDRALVDIDVAAPDAVEQLLAAEYPPRMLQKKLQ